MNSIQTIAFVVNLKKTGADSLATSLEGAAESLGVQTRSTTAYPLSEEFLTGIDACCVIGGDGTLLGVVSEAVRNQVPVLGVNLGKLGFLATFAADEVLAEFESLLSGDIQVATRSLLQCHAASEINALALNDVVIKNQAAGLVSLDVFSDKQHVNEYNCDGLVFSTPTGSTAYNLSAGGPLIHPNAEVIAVTPICPHTLSNRSVIFDHQTILEVLLRNRQDGIQVSIDGVVSCHRPEDFPLRISIATQTFKLIQHRKHSHFQLVRSKLRWGDGNTI